MGLAELSLFGTLFGSSPTWLSELIYKHQNKTTSKGAHVMQQLLMVNKRKT